MEGWFQWGGKTKRRILCCDSRDFFVGPLSRARDPIERAEQDRLLEIKLETCLRSVFHQCVLSQILKGQRYNCICSSLLTDPKSRKVILVEHPLLPLYIKETMARILFNNLQVCKCSTAVRLSFHIMPIGAIHIVRVKPPSVAPGCRTDYWSCSRLWPP